MKAVTSPCAASKTSLQRPATISPSLSVTLRHARQHGRCQTDPDRGRRQSSSSRSCESSRKAKPLASFPLPAAHLRVALRSFRCSSRRTRSPRPRQVKRLLLLLRQLSPARGSLWTEDEMGGAASLSCAYACTVADSMLFLIRV
jgi:hypothetical protein